MDTRPGKLTDPTTFTRSTSILLAILIMFTGLAAAEDIRTLTVRVVPDTMWDAAPTAVRVQGINNADHAKSDAYSAQMNTWIEKAFTKLGYTVSGDADIVFEHTLEVLDPGSAAARFAVGFGVGKSFVEGRVTVREGETVLGQYSFSARPKGAGVKQMSKEVGPAVVLQIHNREADEKLHEYKKGKKKDDGTDR